MKPKEILEDIFIEKIEKGIKIFYNTNIFIQEFPEEEEETPPEEEIPPKKEAPSEKTSTEEDTKRRITSLITEAIHKFQSSGEIDVPEEDATNIQTLEDLLDYISDKSVDGKKILDDLAVEVALSLADIGTKPIEEVINKGDKIMIDVDYGSNKDDSIGFKVLKNAGSNTVSITMKKDGKVIPSPFDLPVFNRQVVYFRNTLVS